MIHGNNKTNWLINLLELLFTKTLLWLVFLFIIESPFGITHVKYSDEWNFHRKFSTNQRASGEQHPQRTHWFSNQEREDHLAVLWIFSKPVYHHYMSILYSKIIDLHLLKRHLVLWFIGPALKASYVWKMLVPGISQVPSGQLRNLRKPRCRFSRSLSRPQEHRSNDDMLKRSYYWDKQVYWPRIKLNWENCFFSKNKEMITLLETNNLIYTPFYRTVCVFHRWYIIHAFMDLGKEP